MVAASQAAVHVVPYDTSWVTLFNAERAYLSTVLIQWIVGGIEHIGSTAVSGLCAKPVIDVMVGVESLAASEPAKRVLEAHGYCYADYKTDVMHWFCKPSEAFRTHHVHLIPYQSPLWFERIQFRDRLRGDPVVAGQYAALKERLARTHCLDREAYTDAKWPFIAAVLGRER